MAVGKKGEKTKRKIFVTAMKLFKEKGTTMLRWMRL